MRPRTGLLLLPAVAALMGNGCGAAIEPISVAPDCPSQPVRGPSSFATEPEVQLISDFESETATATAALNKLGGRDGSWILGMDGTIPTTAWTAESSSDCVARGKWSGHFAGSGFTDWGANWTAIFRNSTTSNATAYDGSKYGGISFWAAFGNSDLPAFEVPVGIATMDTAWNSGGCTTCTDHYLTKVPLTGEWRRYEVLFSDMQQGGRGVPLVPNMRRDQMVGFVVWPRQAFDIWLDDVRFEL